jgi:hypothetical protein
MKQPTSKPETKYSVDMAAVFAPLFLLGIFAFLEDIVRICLWGWGNSPEHYFNSNSVFYDIVFTVIFGFGFFAGLKQNRKSKSIQ